DSSFCMTLHELLDPRHQTRPALSVAFAIFRHRRETAVCDLYLGAAINWSEFPADNSLVQWVSVPAGEPGVLQHSRRIEFGYLAVMNELDSCVLAGRFRLFRDERPHSTGTCIHLPLRKYEFLIASPLQCLVAGRQRLEYPCGRSCDEDVADDR